MFGFLQGFAYGLFLSCLPWLIVGLVNPQLAHPRIPPQRRYVVLRYGVVIPFLAFALWLASLFGGLDPSLAGGLAGLAAIAVEIPLERSWRRKQAEKARRTENARLEAAAARKRAQLEQEQREAGNAVLDPDLPPVGADDVILALAEAKKQLLAVRRPELATQADRLYTRYTRVTEAIGTKFDPRELTLSRWRELVAEVCRGAIDNLQRMNSQIRGSAGIDPDYIRRRLSGEGSSLPEEERRALQRRLELHEDTERCLRQLSASNEAALTALDDATVAIARIETDRPQASVAADLALQELRRYIDRAELYGHRKETL